jgi:transcriptional regulator with XRE-family HTH domain
MLNQKGLTMQALAAKNNDALRENDHLRIKELIETAARQAGGNRALAQKMEVHEALISNWKNGVKTPSPEAQAELAVYAKADPMVVTFMATMAKASGKRLTLMQNTYQDWMKKQTPRITSL